VGRTRRLIFLEIPVDEVFDGGEGGFCVVAFSADNEDGPVAGGEHHEAHDAFAIDLLTVFFDGDIAGELAGGLDELGRGPGVDAELVADGEFAPDYVGL